MPLSPDLQERKKRILSVDFLSSPKPKDNPINRPLHTYQTGDKNLYDLVIDKWNDENQYITDQYTQQVRAIYDQKTLTHEQQSQKIGISAHQFIKRQESVQADFTRQSVLAALYVKRKEKSIPALKKASKILSLLLMIGSLISCASLGADTLQKGAKITSPTKVSLSMVGLFVLAALSVGHEKRRIHHEGIKIKSNLMCWHRIAPAERGRIYSDIMVPSHMGLCGFLETFQTGR